MDKKKILFTALIGALLIVTVFVLINFGSPSKVKINPAFRNYISAFTSGVVSTESVIKIELANDFADSSIIDKPLEEELFSFYPEIKGHAIWTNSRTIEYHPDEPMKSNTVYTAKFFISEIMEMPDSLETFVFQFKTTKQEAILEVWEHKAYQTDRPERERITGVIKTADVAKTEDVKAGLKATLDGKDLPISIVPSSERRSFTFTVDSVVRAKDKNVVDLSFDSDKIGAKGTLEQSVTIPGLNEFVMTGIRVFGIPEQSLEIQFSDPLMQDQSLDGLIELGDLGGLTYLIEDNVIRIYLSEEESGEFDLKIDKSLQNYKGETLKESILKTVKFEK